MSETQREIVRAKPNSGYFGYLGYLADPSNDIDSTDSFSLRPLSAALQSLWRRAPAWDAQRLTRVCLGWAVGMAGLATVGLAAAEEAPTSMLPVVKVQSGHLEQSQFDAAASVVALDRETIQASGPLVNVSDVLNRVPGVVALNRNNYAQDVQISIRGFGSRAAFGLRGIRLITDGIPATTPDGQGQASTISLTSADRMEVLTGPLAQIYGNASGGVIQTFTREAGEKPEFQTQVAMGSYGLMRTDWQMSGRSGQVGVVADYSTFNIGGYRTNSDARRQQLNSVVTVDASPDTRWKLVLNMFEMPQAGDALGLTQAQLTANPAQAGTGSVTYDTRKIVSQKQVGAVMDHRIDRGLQLSARLYSGMRDNLQYQTGTGATGKWTGLNRHFDGLGLQLKGQNQINSLPFDWVVGLDKDHSGEVRQAGTTSAGQKQAGVNRNEFNQSDNQDWFAQANWMPSTHWTVTTGARRSQVTLKSSDYYLTDGVDGSGSVRYQATNPVLGATWHAAETLNVYANLGKGFETPTLAEAAFVTSGSSVVGRFNPNLQASVSQHRELGTKWTPTPASRVNLALFRITTDNEIVPAISASGSTAYVNATRTAREGLEWSWNQLWSAHWRSLYSGTLMRVKYDQGFSTTAAGNIPSGNWLPSIPGKQTFASMQWSEHGFAPAGQAAAHGFEGSLDWVTRSRVYANDLNTLVAPGYGLLNTRIRHRTQGSGYQLETYLGVDNIANRNTVGSVIVNQSSAQSFEPGLPRSWVLGMTVKVPL